MSINLLKMLQDQIGSPVVDQASKFLGESSANTSSGINALLPTVLGGLVNKGNTESGASSIMDMITKGNFDGGILDNLGNVFSGGSSTSNFMNAGSLLTSSLFGGSKLGSVLDVVTKVTGMRRSSSSSLMNLLAPIVMGMIGKQVKSNGLNAGGLMKMLMGQKDHVASAMPAGMGSILGFSNMRTPVTETVGAATTRTATAARETVRETANVTTDVAKTGGSWIRWALPLVAIVALGAWLFNRGGADKVANLANDAESGIVEGANTVGDAATKTVNAAGDAANSAAGAMKDGANATGNAISDAAGNMKDAAGNMANDARNAAGNMANDAKNTADNIAEDAKDGSNKLGAKIKNAANKTGSAVAGAADKTGDAIGNAANATGGALSAGAMKVKEKFTGMFKSGSSAPAYTLKEITFDPESNKITDYDKDEVMALAAALKADPNAKVEVKAFSNTGKNALQNKTIAMARAKVVQQMLTTLGVKSSQLSSSGSAAKAATDANNVQIVVK